MMTIEPAPDDVENDAVNDMLLAVHDPVIAVMYVLVDTYWFHTSDGALPGVSLLTIVPQPVLVYEP